MFILQLKLHLRVENKRPNVVCTGNRMKKTDIPARQDGPIIYSNNNITHTACSGPSHRKCKYKVTCKRTMKRKELQMHCLFYSMSKSTKL